ncbi:MULTISPECIES: PQQ-binding-like beta-propeller repeat protein [unclassified Carboxylicivirga]|uniref:outer membrane protein assembly factor BamB family protein n=1 Tax=Carboxylicivirga TaxID=1628153 RepID=UPI003D34ACAF
MKQKIYRNIAIVSAIFITTLAIMLITNYFQVKEVSPLQTQVVETLKQLNDQNAGNTELQEQIRQLDLMARKAYFISMDHLMNGVYLLLGMLVVFVVCTRLYYAHFKDVPDKELDPIDEWAVKSKARKYVNYGAVSIVVVAAVFIIFSIPFMENASPDTKEKSVAQLIETETPEPQETTQAAKEVGAAADELSTAPENSGDEADEESEVVTAKVEVGNETKDVGIIADETKAVADVPGSVAAEKSPASAPKASETSGETKETKATEITESTEPKKSMPLNKINSPAFRGNKSNGISPAQNLPIKWDLAKGTNIAWQTKINGKGQSSPVIHSNKIFITCGDEKARELFCYDLITGQKLWTYTATGIPGSPARVPETTDDTGLASASVATNGKQVCAVFGTGDLVCTDMDGNKLWAKNLGVPDNHYGYASSLLIFDNKLFIQYDNNNVQKVMALNPATGEVIWSKNRKERITWSSPMIADVNGSPQLVLMGNPGITGYNPATGDELWRVECLMGEVGASACSMDGIVFGASEYAKMVAINASDGSVLWESMDYLPEVASPVATQTDIYIATSYGVVASFDTKTGELKKEHETNEEFYSSPILAEGKIYLISNNGTMHIFKADDDFALLETFATGENTYATPAFTDGRIVVRTNNSIYCVKAN